MAFRRIKTPVKMYTSNLKTIESIIIQTMDEISNIVGCSLGPGGRNVIIESDLPDIPNKNTKDGVTIFRALGANDPFKHLIIEQTRDAAVRTVSSAGDGPQPLYSKILTPRGFIEMRDVEVGMDICGTDGSIQKVLGVYPKGEKQICKVVFSDGREVECCPDHLWEVTTNYGTKKVLTTEEISKDFVNNDYYLPPVFVNFIENKEEMTLDSYTVGALVNLLSSDSVFIPTSYLISSAETRKNLLDGLLDTNANANKLGLISYTTASDQLANNIVFLARSLGKIIKHTKKDKINEIQELDASNVKIVNVIKTNEFTDMQCIKVSNDNHLYITDNFIPTHNTTTATIIAAALIKNLFNFCHTNRKYSPQKVTRIIQKILQEKLVPIIQKNSITITDKNKALLKKVATISTNGDTEMAEAVIKAFDSVGYGASSHVTIQELSGPSGYEVELIEGFPIMRGYEESIGKFHTAFINDRAHQRCSMEKPLFLLFDGKINDMVQIHTVLSRIGQAWVEGDSEFKNVVIVAHKFGDQVLTQLSFNFNNPQTIDVVPLTTPISPIANAELEFLRDLSAFTGATIFDMSNSLSDATPDDFGKNMEKIEISRFRTTIVGDPEALNLDSRVEELQIQLSQSESKIERILLEERMGKLTSGIAKLKLFGSSNGELKEKADRAEDAVCAVRAAITHGCVPGGCRVLINLGLSLQDTGDPICQEILIPSLFAPFYRLLDNAGYCEEEIQEILVRMIEDPEITYDVENAKFGDPKKMGILDATLAVEQAIKNAVSIASVMGTLGGMIVTPRDHQLEREHASEDLDMKNTIDNPEYHVNEANKRP